MDLATVLLECSTEEYYRETCIRIAGNKRYDLHALDGLWHELRTKKGRHLQTSDIESMFSDVTHYGYYWKAPVGVNLEAAKISLCEADRGTTDQAVKLWRHNLVQSLFVKLKSMEVASVVLSCVHSKDFGVFSPPTLMILQIPLMPPVQYYLAYCEELAAWGGQFLGNDSAGLADRALWAFYQAAYGHKKTDKASPYQDAFDNDKWVRQRHALGVLKPHFPRWTPLEQARFLIDIDGNLAAMIAGCEFEVRIKELVDHDKPIRDKKIGQFKQTSKPDGHDWGHLEAMIEYVVRRNKGTYGAYREQLQCVRDLRNQAIHDERLLQKHEIALMIDMTAKLPEGRKLQRLTLSRTGS